MLTPPKAWKSSEDDDFLSNDSSRLEKMLKVDTETSWSSPEGKNDYLNSFPKVGGRHTVIPANCLIDEYFLDSLGGSSSALFGLSPQPLIRRPVNLQSDGHDQIFWPNTNSTHEKDSISDLFDPFVNEQLVDDIEVMSKSPPLKTRRNEEAELRPDVDPFLQFGGGVLFTDINTAATYVNPEVVKAEIYGKTGTPDSSDICGLGRRTAYSGGENQQQALVPSVTPEKGGSEKFVSSDPASSTIEMGRNNAEHPDMIQRQLSFSARPKTIVVAITSPIVPGISQTESPGAGVKAQGHASVANVELGATLSSGCSTAAKEGGDLVQPNRLFQSELPRVSFTPQGYPSSFDVEVGVLARTTGFDTVEREGKETGQAIASKKNRESSIRAYQAQSWNKKFQEAKCFLKKHGHCRIPHDYRPNPDLARWAKRQRYQYTLFTEKGIKATSLTYERIHCLRAIGFVFEIHRDVWEDRYQEMIQFRIRNGHTNVPTDYKNKKLATWVKCQRRQYKLWEASKPSSITKERIDKLELIGFHWRAISQKWDRKLPVGQQQRIIV